MTNIQNITPDDPRLTAYVLGELSKNELVEIEAVIAQSPELQEAVEDIRCTAALITDELQTELVTDGESVVALPVEAAGMPIPSKPIRFPYLVPAAMAACVCVAATATYFMMTQIHFQSEQIHLVSSENVKGRGLSLDAAQEAMGDRTTLMLNQAGHPFSVFDEKTRANVVDHSTPDFSETAPQVDLANSSSSGGTGGAPRFEYDVQVTSTAFAGTSELSAEGLDFSGGEIFARTDVSSTPQANFRSAQVLAEELQDHRSGAIKIIPIPGGQAIDGNEIVLDHMPVSEAEVRVSGFGDQAAAAFATEATTVDGSMANHGPPVASNGNIKSVTESQDAQHESLLGLQHVANSSDTNTLTESNGNYFLQYAQESDAALDRVLPPNYEDGGRIDERQLRAIYVPSERYVSVNKGDSFHDGAADVSHLAANGGTFPEGVSSFQVTDSSNTTSTNQAHSGQTYTYDLDASESISYGLQVPFGPRDESLDVAPGELGEEGDGHKYAWMGRADMVPTRAATVGTKAVVVDADGDDEYYFSGGMVTLLNENPDTHASQLPSPGDGWWMTVEYPDDIIIREPLVRPYRIRPGGARYEPVIENPFKTPIDQPLSTFSIDVDTAAYTHVRGYLERGMMPPPGAVRVEEFINYFSYDYPTPDADQPFSVNIEVASCPWKGEHRLAMVGLQGYEVSEEDRPSANLVFLIDTSGSMADVNKLALVKKSLMLLLDQMRDDDFISIVTYAGSAKVALDATSAHYRGDIADAIDEMAAGGGTNGESGIDLAYDLAGEHFIEGGINRVILLTDGDFNVGATSHDQLLEIIKSKSQGGIFLSVFGFGMGHYNDSMLEKLANKGDGNYGFIDDIDEAQKLLVDQMGGTLMTIAKDVKIQVEFNPALVSAYRLIGYENRTMAARDFNDDTKDAGEIGAGHSVTALYEIIPAGEEIPDEGVDELKYQKVQESAIEIVESDELMTVKLRYKDPDADESQLIEVPVIDDGGQFVDSSDNFALASSTAAMAMLLRGSQYVSDLTFEDVLAMAESTMQSDAYGYRKELCDLIEKAISIKATETTVIP